MRKVSDIPANRLACYEWKEFAKAMPAEGEIICVSVPFECAPEHRAVAEFKDGKFLLAFDETPLKDETPRRHAACRAPRRDRLQRSHRYSQ